MRVLVTGGRGFLGRAVTADLVGHGHTVTVASRSADHHNTPAGSATARVDLRDRTGVHEVVSATPYEAVVHLAALTNAAESIKEPLRYYDVNVLGTLNLLTALDKAARDTGRTAHLVFASTHLVYGPPPAGPLGEDRPPHPENPYAATKLTAEQLLQFHARTGTIGTVTLRCFNIAGAAAGHADPDRTRLIPAILHAAATGQTVPVHGDGSATRDFVHVSDVATAVRLALHQATPGTAHTYNVGTGHGTTVRDLLRTAEAVTGQPIQVEHRPGRPGPDVVVADSTRIRQKLGWTPTRSSPEQLLRDAWTALPATPAR